MEMADDESDHDDDEDKKIIHGHVYDNNELIECKINMMIKIKLIIIYFLIKILLERIRKFHILLILNYQKVN